MNGLWVQWLGFKVQDLGFRVCGTSIGFREFRSKDLGVWYKGSEMKVMGLGFRVWGSGFGI